MAVNINTFKNFTEFVANKAQTGNSVTVTQFGLVANQAQLVIFEKDYQTFTKTGEISEYLQTFIKTTNTSVPSSGVYTLPSDYQHMSSVRHYYVQEDGVGAMIPVNGVDVEEWGLAQISKLMKPSSRFPKYNEAANTLRFLPRTIGLIEMDYFKTPIVPVWGYTTVNNRPVYDPLTSTDFEWDAFALNTVASAYLSLIGCNLKDMELGAFANQFKAETNSIL